MVVFSKMRKILNLGLLATLACSTIQQGTPWETNDSFCEDLSSGERAKYLFQRITKEEYRLKEKLDLGCPEYFTRYPSQEAILGLAARQGNSLICISLQTYNWNRKENKKIYNGKSLFFRPVKDGLMGVYTDFEKEHGFFLLYPNVHGNSNDSEVYVLDKKEQKIVSCEQKTRECLLIRGALEVNLKVMCSREHAKELNE